MSKEPEEWNPWVVAIGVLVVVFFLSWLCTGNVTPR